MNVLLIGALTVLAPYGSLTAPSTFSGEVAAGPYADVAECAAKLGTLYLQVEPSGAVLWACEER